MSGSKDNEDITKELINRFSTELQYEIDQMLIDDLIEMHKSEFEKKIPRILDELINM